MQALEALLTRHWWRSKRSLLAHALLPAAWLYRLLFALNRALARGGQAAPVPTVVVGNVVVGGVGKTPLVIGLVQALQAAGFRPGVLSRGYGRQEQAAMAVTLQSAPQAVGDEPLLIHRRTGVPTWVGRQRLAAARALCAANPQVDVLVCDDGLQHHALAPDAALLVFDARGVGNGLLLPAGPLREPLPRQASAATWVVYTCSSASTPLPGLCVPRVLGAAVPIEAWRAGASESGYVGSQAPNQAARQAATKPAARASSQPLAALRGRPFTALAGIGSPESFFTALEAQGLSIVRHPMPDHADYRNTPPWPAGTQDVITTEKDAVKLTAELIAQVALQQGFPAPAVWVVPLDSPLPPALMQPLLQRLRAMRREPRSLAKPTTP
jgi:tetraacyldisaccharide 4'-kinase